MSFLRRGFVDQPVVAHQLAAGATAEDLTLSAPLVLAAGTLAAPSLRFAGHDAGTGLSGETTDQIVIGRLGVNFVTEGVNGHVVSTAFGASSTAALSGALRIAAETTKTGNYPVTTTDTIVIMNGTTLTATLPASPAGSQTVWIKNIDSGNCTIARNGKTIDGAAADITLAAGASALLHYDGTGWFRLGS